MLLTHFLEYSLFAAQLLLVGTPKVRGYSRVEDTLKQECSKNVF